MKQNNKYLQKIDIIRTKNVEVLKIVFQETCAKYGI